METLSFPPLISLFREKRTWCNQVFAAKSVRYPSLSPERVKQVIVTVFEPLMKILFDKRGNGAADLFDTLYETLIDLEGSDRLKASPDVYVSVLTLVSCLPPEALARPREVIRPLISAATTLSKRYPGACSTWVNLMEKAVPHCPGLDEVLQAGRVCAWVSGLAHLRERAVNAMETLPAQAARTILDWEPGMADNPWFNPRATLPKGMTFRYRAGGFRGLGGPFLRPPYLGFSGGRFLATDGMTVSAVFADAFGVSVLPEVPVSPDEIPAENKTVTPCPYPEFTDIRSWILEKNTLMLTRSSSHFIYIYGVNHG